MARQVLEILRREGVKDFGVRAYRAGEYPRKLRDAQDPVELLYYQGWWGLIARRHHASIDEEEEFCSELKMKLVEDNYAIFRKFKGATSIKTFLTIVATTAFQDFRARHWGRRRPSAEAIRLGQVAVKLEGLVSDEGLTLDEASEVLRINHRVTESRQELEEIWKRLPKKASRRIEGEEKLKDLLAPEDRPEGRIFERELRESRVRVYAALRGMLKNLPEEDQSILKMRFWYGTKGVDIARRMGLESKPLYRRLQKILSQLRNDLERAGVRCELVDDFFIGTEVVWGFSGRRCKALGTEVEEEEELFAGNLGAGTINH